MTFPGIFLPVDTENPFFVVLVFCPEKPNQTEDEICITRFCDKNLESR
jgi:hypothetical protein